MKTLKHDEIYPRSYRTMDDVIAHLPHFLEHIYNDQRQHSGLDDRSPKAFEAEHALTLSPGQIAIPRVSNQRGSLHTGWGISDDH